MERGKSEKEKSSLKKWGFCGKKGKRRKRSK
jgi:hypothetical protein